MATVLTACHYRDDSFFLEDCDDVFDTLPDLVEFYQEAVGPCGVCLLDDDPASSPLPLAFSNVGSRSDLLSSPTVMSRRTGGSLRRPPKFAVRSTSPEGYETPTAAGMPNPAGFRDVGGDDQDEHPYDNRNGEEPVQEPGQGTFNKDANYYKDEFYGQLLDAQEASTTEEYVAGYDEMGGYYDEFGGYYDADGGYTDSSKG